MKQTIYMLFRQRTRVLRNERGFTLVEALVAIAIVSIAFTALLAALSTGAMATNKADKRITAQTLARSQLEYTKALEYKIAPTTYDTFTPIPEGYTVVAEASPIDGYDEDVQKITVTVSHQGEVVQVMEDLKVNR